MVVVCGVSVILSGCGKHGDGQAKSSQAIPVDYELSAPNSKLEVVSSNPRLPRNLLGPPEIIAEPKVLESTPKMEAKQERENDPLVLPEGSDKPAFLRGSRADDSSGPSERTERQRNLDAAFANYLSAKSRYEGDAKEAAFGLKKYPFEVLLFQNVGWQFAPRPKKQDPYLRQEFMRAARDLRNTIEDTLPNEENAERKAKLQEWLTKLEEMLGPRDIPDPKEATPQRPELLPGVKATPEEIIDYLKRHRR